MYVSDNNLNIFCCRVILSSVSENRMIDKGQINLKIVQLKIFVSIKQKRLKEYFFVEFQIFYKLKEFTLKEKSFNLQKIQLKDLSLRGKGIVVFVSQYVRNRMIDKGQLRSQIVYIEDICLD
eukprot:TRINITY_DN1452_c0_g1_i2.p3 TRINITY_DN1452_c0_g1~~TRINITY_DN1452_c0_g1_i2.p3  ORF type:complete len:122 (+),score=2.69 TRINITY_DN1452_c0_g1_i2:3-368(+)